MAGSRGGGSVGLRVEYKPFSLSVTPSCLRSSPRPDASKGNGFRCFSPLPTEGHTFPSRPWASSTQSMSTLRFTEGVGVGFSGACGLPLVWRVRKSLSHSLPCALS